MRYNRADIADTMRAAKQLAKGWQDTVYVYARAGGFVIERQIDKFSQAGYCVDCNGNVLKVGKFHPGDADDDAQAPPRGDHFPA